MENELSEHETPDFHTTVDPDGCIRIPASYITERGFGRGAKVAVRVTELVLSEDMRQKGISEEEVETIGGIQLEAREDVLTFLASEGVLSGSTEIAQRLRREG